MASNPSVKTLPCILVFVSLIFGVEATVTTGQSVTPPRIYVHVFLSKDCPHCEPVQEQALSRLSQRLNCRIVPRYHDLDDMVEYKRLVLLERKFQKRGNDLPVVVIGERLIGGKSAIEKELETILGDFARAGGCPDIAIPSTQEIAAAFPATRESAQPICLAYFEHPGCRQCLRVEKMLGQMAREFPNLKIERFSQTQRPSRILFEVLGEKANLPISQRLIVPAVFIGGDALVKESLDDDALRTLIEKHAPDGASPSWNVSSAELDAAKERLVRRFRALGVGAVLIGGLIDGVNPCAFAVMAFLLSYMASLGRTRSDMLWGGISFGAGVFGAYFAVGVGLSELLSRLEFLPRLSLWLRWGIVGLTFVLAILSLWDSVSAKRQKGMVVKLPSAWRRYINVLIARQLRTRQLVIATLFLGFVISLIEVACTGQVYLPLVQFMCMISVDRLRTYALLAIYNLAFIAPLLGIFAMVYFGAGTDKITALTHKHMALTKLLLAGVFAGTGVLLLWL